MKHLISHAELLELKRWDTPTIYNGWEQITNHDIGHEGINLEPSHDFMPCMLQDKFIIPCPKFGTN